MAKILIVDDDPQLRKSFIKILSEDGHTMQTAGTGEAGIAVVEKDPPDLVIMDVRMPGMSGIEAFETIHKIEPSLPVIIMTAFGTTETAIKATKMGAFDYILKPFEIPDILELIEKALQVGHFVRGQVKMDESPRTRQEEAIIGRSLPMQEVYKAIGRTAPTDATVLIRGESGTGKELVARALHDFGARRNKPFVAINMAAIPRDLIESELFGHEKGAFTGATNRSAGRFEQAQGGTLFLDEIGDMPPEAQTRLLRVLQEGEYTTVGGRISIKTNVRIIAATHRDLKQLIRQGSFREDLFFRLNVAPLRIPPLRERPEDVAELVRHFLAQAAAEGLPWKTIAPEAMERLKRYTWPGNVRELENMVKRLAALCAEEEVGPKTIEAELAEAPPTVLENDSGGLAQSVERHLQAYFTAHGDGLPAAGLYERILHEIERPLLQLTLDATRGNQVRASEVLGLNRNTLRKKIRELDIPVIRGGAK